MKEAGRDISQSDYLWRSEVKMDLYREMIVELGAQFHLQTVRYRAYDQRIELGGILLELGDDEAEVIRGIRETPGTIISWISYRDWPEYENQVR